MELKIGKKAEIPIHWIILFAVVLIIVIILSYNAYTKGGGLIGGIINVIKGGR